MFRELLLVFALIWYKKSLTSEVLLHSEYELLRKKYFFTQL